jgi:hypothetical protein
MLEIQADEFFLKVYEVELINQVLPRYLFGLLRQIYG